MSLIEQLPTYEKPREKAIQFGIDSLSNTELLALLIRHGTKNHSALEIAKELLEKSGGIGRLSSSSLHELMNVKGISQVKAVELQAVFTLIKRICFERIEEKEHTKKEEKDYEGGREKKSKCCNLQNKAILLL